MNGRKISKSYKESKRYTFSSNSENSEVIEESGCRGNVGYTRRKRFKVANTLGSTSETDKTEGTLNHEEDDSTQFVWRNENLKPIVYDFDTSNSGIKANIDKLSSILEAFQLFFSEELIGFVVEETNKYQSFKLENMPNGYSSRFKARINTSVNEMYSFLAVTMLMSRMRKLSLAEYWSTNRLIKTESFKEIMTKERYSLLLQLIHFHDSTTTNIDDPLMKVCAIIDRLRDSFAQSFYPFRNLCISENLLLFKERSFLRQYIPAKSSRVGVKSFVLRDCKTGYIQDFLIYSESCMTRFTDKNTTKLGRSGNIVMTLLQPYLQKGHILVCDNWYTSPPLFLQLHENMTNAFGIVQRNRPEMPNMTEVLRKGEYSVKSTDCLLALKWFDKTDIFMLFTYHSAELIKIENKHLETGKPNIQLFNKDYNYAMNVIDKTDVILNSINSVRKTLKWHKKYIFICLIYQFIMLMCYTKLQLVEI